MDDLAAFTAHGGRVDAARAAFGGEDWIDLSTGIAPWPYPVEGLSLGLDRLPESDAIAELEAAAAATFGIAPHGVVAVPGTDLAMRLLAPVIDATRSAVMEPGYAGHRAAWPDATPVGGHAEASDADLLVLASPANPTGRVADLTALDRLTATTTVVLDQAYADPDPCPAATDRLIVLRSFGKFYGLPGVRLGFVAAGPTMVERLRLVLGDWPVSSVAVAIGTAAYRDAAWRDAQARRIDVMGAALDGALARAGLPIVGRAPLFRLVETGDAGRLFRRLARRAILTRPFATRSGWLRIGLPHDAAALARLSSALEDADA